MKVDVFLKKKKLISGLNFIVRFKFYMVVKLCTYIDHLLSNFVPIQLGIPLGSVTMYTWNWT
jgi:hypothetical protein